MNVRVQAALAILPAHFEFATHFEGINATDLFSLNAVLGTSIEVEVVKTLNRLRDVWDPDSEWLGYRFERQSQTFPDIRLLKSGNPPDIAMGIELKGWYLLAKEGVPTFRFRVTPAACHPFDLIVVVPWLLSNVLSGSPVAREPWVASALSAAEYRNDWWQNVREASSDKGIKSPPDAHPYPTKVLEILDVPNSDTGNNFGRLARVPGLMTDFISAAVGQEALGIPIRHWIAFLRQHSDKHDAEALAVELEGQLRRQMKHLSGEQAKQIVTILEELARFITGASE